MSIRASVYIATSLDGFIARPDGDIDWLEQASAAASESDYGYQAFMDTVDAIVMGRGTFEKALGFDPWPYAGKRVVALSRSMAELPSRLEGHAELSHLDPVSLCARLEAEGVRHIYVDGGRTIQSFLRAGLITDMTITTIPVLIGEGLPLFGPLGRDLALEHIATQAFPNGFVQSRYRPASQ
ncbi:dihydrofolate reductase [Chloroflexia bacterium SDU3-3]|nr:dihydrofolate reductase [Chloroflexia bacterium SDU3-3]